MADLTEDGQRVLVAQGGHGGRGNAQFATSTNRAPRRADPGYPGEAWALRLQLKLLADVGLVGYPNAGKSTLISRISAAKPKIADYPFTTLTPHLGVVRLDDDRSFVVADVPGLIEGAHRGLGLGHQFLRHIERTKVLIYMVDVSSTSGREAADDLTVIRRELELFRAELLERPQLVAATKIDAVDEPERLERLRARAGEWRLPVFPISAVTGQGRAGAARGAVAWDGRGRGRPRRRRGGMTPLPGRTGVLGGTFDPVHVGHMAAAEAARRALALDQVLFIPSHRPPHRAAPPRASAFHRFAMVSLAVERHPDSWRPTSNWSGPVPPTRPTRSGGFTRRGTKRRSFSSSWARTRLQKLRRGATIRPSSTWRTSSWSRGQARRSG